MLRPSSSGRGSMQAPSRARRRPYPIQAADNVIILTGSGIVPVGSLSSTGLMGGVQLGYNLQYGRFVYGMEAELGGLYDGASLSIANRSLTGLLQINSSGGFFGISPAGRAF